MAEKELRNDTEYEFADISTEKRRVYDFGGVNTVIENPQWLAVSDNGHRILDSDGICHYIGYSGVYFYWQVEDNQPHFVK
jgi:hypothetical protein